MNDIQPKEVFQDNKLVVIHGVLTENEIDLFTNYCLIREKIADFYIDPQSPGAFSSYADSLMEALMLNLQPVIEQCTGLELFPTYSYYRVYRNGHDLFEHTDRPSCEISASVGLGYSYDTEKYQWPLYVNNYKIILNPGDIAIYRGIELPHWRNPLDINQEAYHCQAFLHYVDANGPNKEYKYDNREFIGDRSKIKKTNNKNI